MILRIIARLVLGAGEDWSTLIQLAGSVAGQGLEERIEVGQVGVFDDDAAAAFVVFNVDLEAEGPLQLFGNFADIGIDRRLGLGLLLFIFRIEQALNVGFCLTNRKRKSGDTLGSFLDVFSVLQTKKHLGVAKAEFAGFDARLNA